MLEAKRAARHQQPAPAATLRVSPKATERDGHQQGELHLHDEVTAVINHHGRNSAHEHGERRAQPPEQVGKKQSDDEQGHAAKHGDKAQIGFSPSRWITPAGDTSPEAAHLVESRTVVVFGIVLEVACPGVVRQLHAEDGLIRVHGAAVESGETVERTQAQGQNDQEQKGADGNGNLFASSHGGQPSWRHLGRVPMGNGICSAGIRCSTSEAPGFADVEIHNLPG